MLAMVKQGSEDMLRQSVFSSIHMSSELKTGQVSLGYPRCTFCGGMTLGKKSNAARKTTLCQLSLYTNSSESFVVWYKKMDEPKGILWLRSCCVRRGANTDGIMPIELISRGCQGRCSYTLRFSQRRSAEEWYQLLRREARRNDSVDGDDPFNSGDSGDECNPLQSILSDIPEDSSSEDSFSRTSPTQSATSTRSPSPSKKPPGKTKHFRLPFSHMKERKVGLPNSSSMPSTRDTPSSPETGISRWSWPAVRV